MGRRAGVCAMVLACAAGLCAPAAASVPGRNGLIVWQRESRRIPPHVWVANPDGSAARRVFAQPDRGDGEITTSPTDPNVVFFSRGTPTPFSEDIVRGDLTTGAVTPVISTPRSADIAATISPDGTRLAYFTAPRPRGRLDEDTPPPPNILHVANVDGSGDHAISPATGLAIDPDWSPDGQRLVYTESRLTRRGVQNRLAIVAADGSGRVTLTAYGGADEVNPKWLPDGSGIVFERLKETGSRSDILRVGADGGPASVILATRAWETNPVPSPDGTRILFTSDRDRRGGDRLGGGFELYTMNLDGTGIVRLTNNARPDIFPDWQRLP